MASMLEDEAPEEAERPLSVGELGATSPGSGPQQMAAASGGGRRTLVGRFVEWLTRTASLRAAVDQEHRAGAKHELGRRALSARNLALSLSSSRGVDGGLESSIAIDLHRQAIYWLLAAQLPTPGTAEQVWENTSPLVLLEAAGSEETLERNRELVTGSFISLAEVPFPSEASRQLAVFYEQLFAHFDSSHAATARLRFQRLYRLGAVVACLGAGVYGLWRIGQRAALGSDLASSAEWRASSKLSKCTLVEGKCRGKKVDIFFHTKKEKSPWMEYDFKRAVTFSHVELVNRSDCCVGRATPLVVETSSDRREWARVASRDKTFTTVMLEFEPATARYMRIRALKTTALHLERVAVFR